MSEGTARRLAVVTFAVTVALLVVSSMAGVVFAQRGVITWGLNLTNIAFSSALLVFSLVGLVIARRHPRNAVAWVLLGVGMAWEVGGILDAYYRLGEIASWGVPGPQYAAVFASAGWVPGIVPLGTFLILLFPDGHLPSRRWRGWAWLCAAAPTGLFVLILFSPGELVDSTPPVMNPLGIDALGRVPALLYGSVMLIPVCIAGCAVAMVQRYRRSTGVERLQLKWFASAGAVVVASYVTMMVVSIPYDWNRDTTPVWLGILQNVSLATFMLIPIAVAIAILRHRLYDIDRIISRALTYTAATLLLGSVYVGSVIASQNVLRGVTGQAQNNLAVAASTLAVAALFRPVRGRVQRLVDRRFYRAKYDAVNTIEQFAARLRQETDLATLSDELRGVVGSTVQPDRVSLWISGTG